MIKVTFSMCTYSNGRFRETAVTKAVPAIPHPGHQVHLDKVYTVEGVHWLFDVDPVEIVVDLR